MNLIKKFGGNIPSCNDTKKLVHVYAGSCIYEQECTYSSSSTISVVCDPENSTPPYDPGTSNSFTITRHIPCGDICCRDEYEICRVGIEGQMGSYIKIVKTGTVPGECPPYSPGPALKDCQPICGY